MQNIEDPKGKGVSREAIIRILSIAGVAGILIIGMWGAVSVAKGAPSALSSLAAVITSLTSVFVPAGEKIVISVPSLTVNAGEPFGISWEHVKKSGSGSYTFRYDCADGVSFTSPSASGAAETVYCNTPFNFVTNNNSIILTASSTKNRFVDVTLYVDYTPNGASRPTVTGSSLLTVANGGITTSPGTLTPVKTPTTTPVTHPAQTPGTPTSTTYPISGTGNVSNPNGIADLASRVIEVGIVDKTTGVFTASSTPNRHTDSYRVAIHFAVENLGTKASGGWTFNAVLPTYPSYIFSSPSQASLNPGDRIEFTLGFDSVADQDASTVTINVDPAGSLNESNETNNIVQYTLHTVK